MLAGKVFKNPTLYLSLKPKSGEGIWFSAVLGAKDHLFTFSFSWKCMDLQMRRTKASKCRKNQILKHYFVLVTKTISNA